MTPRFPGERKRLHDEAHFPLHGKGNKPVKRRKDTLTYKCSHPFVDHNTRACVRCGEVVPGYGDSV